MPFITNGTLIKVVANITPSRTTLSEPYRYNSPHWDSPKLQEGKRVSFIINFITHYLTIPFLHKSKPRPQINYIDGDLLRL